MTNIVGTAGDDFIHRVGDGNVPPAAYNEIIGVTAGSDTIDAGGGDDIVFGDAGDDTLKGGAGADTLDGGTGNDVMIGGAGNDVYVVDLPGDITVEASNEGTDTVQAAISWLLSANVENLTLTGTDPINGTGNSLANVIVGNAGANNLNGGGGADTMIGGGGNDLYRVDNIADLTIEGAGGGTDAVQSAISWTLAADVENLTLTGAAASAGTGNASNNVIIGNAAANVLSGLGGADWLDGKAGADMLSGGIGNDVYVVDDAGDVTVELAGEGTDAVRSAISWTLAANLENLTLIGSAAAGAGNALDNTLTGNAANNTLTGGDGNDRLIGGAGNDKLIGGVGDDLYVVDAGGDTVIEGADAGTDTVLSTTSWVLASNIENLILGGSTAIDGTGNALDNRLTGNVADNVLSGGSGDDVLSGGAGDDKLIGGAGNDRLTGGAGNDTLTGGAGDDLYVVDAGGDTVVEGANAGTDTVLSTTSWVLASNIENLTLGGSTAIDGTGNALNNKLSGNAANNVLSGGAGDDVLSGGAGNDTLTGGAGIDSVSGGAGNDTIVVGAHDLAAGEVYDGGANIDVLDASAVSAADLSSVTLSQIESLYGFSSGLTLTAAQLDGFSRGTLSTGAITLAGAGTVDLRDEDVKTGIFHLSAGGNSLTLNDEGWNRYAVWGDSGADTITIVGGASGAVLSGGAGADILTGGGGSDNIMGGADGDTLRGGGGDDQLTAGGGRDYVDGGAGNDTLYLNAYSEAYAGETYDGGVGIDTLTGNVSSGVNLSGVILTRLESLSGFSHGLTLTAAQLDSFAGGHISTGDLTLSGAGAVNLTDEHVHVGVFNLSAAGNSLTLRDEGYANYVVNGGSGADTVTVVGGSLGSVLKGNAGADALNGGGGDDTLLGGADGDTLRGGDGADKLTGGAGLDHVGGGAGDDLVYIKAASEVVAGETYDGGIGSDTLIGDVSSAVNLSGVGLSGLENIAGFDFGLTLSAAQLAHVSGYIATGAVTISGAGSVNLADTDVHTGVFNLSAGGNRLTLTDEGLNAYTVNGADGADTVTILGGSVGAILNGNGGADTLVGGSADDILTGGTGNDSLFGGAGADQFVFAGIGDGVDKIGDFSGRTAVGGGAGEGDKLVFQGILQGTFEYRGTHGFSASGHTEAQVSTNQLLIDVDGNGSADITLTLTGLTSSLQLQAADFLFV